MKRSTKQNVNVNFESKSQWHCIIYARVTPKLFFNVLFIVANTFQTVTLRFRRWFLKKYKNSIYWKSKLKSQFCPKMLQSKFILKIPKINNQRTLEPRILKSGKELWPEDEIHRENLIRFHTEMQLSNTYSAHWDSITQCLVRLSFQILP